MAELPSKEDLEKLPLTHIVAYAYRRAARVLPLFECWAEKQEAKYDVRSALQFAVDFVSGQVIDHDAAYVAASAARFAAISAKRGFAAETAATAAANACNAAAIASEYAVAKLSATVDAVDADGAYPATSTKEVAKTTAVYAAAAEDYRKLKQLSDNPFDPGPKGPLGPLWPDGEPNWFGESKDEYNEFDYWMHGESLSQILAKMQESREKTERGNEHALVKLKLSFPPGMSDEDIVEYCTNLTDQLNEAYQSFGGEGLTVDDVRRWDPAFQTTGGPK